MSHLRGSVSANNQRQPKPLYKDGAVIKTDILRHHESSLAASTIGSPDIHD